MPKVSIIMPIYNKEKYLRTSIDSVLNQEFSDFELICINDGSTDGSIDILNEFAVKDSRIRIINTDNRGVSSARNTGLKECKGEWIQFLDADDTICSDYLAQCIKIGETNNIDFIFTPFFDEYRGNIKKMTPKRLEPGEIFDQNTLKKKFVTIQFDNGFFGFISNKLFRRTVCRDIYFPANIRLAEDLYFYIDLYKKAKRYMYIDICSFTYFHYEENEWSKAKIDYLPQIYVLRQVSTLINSDPESLTFINQRITKYIYYLFKDSIERKKEIDKEYERVVTDNDLMQCIDKSRLSLFEKMIINALLKHRKKDIKILLKGRVIARNLYRKVKEIGR